MAYCSQIGAAVLLGREPTDGAAGAMEVARSTLASAASMTALPVGMIVNIFAFKNSCKIS